MTVLFLTAVGLGFLFNAAPGAVFAETVKVGVRGGFRPALAVQLGSLVGDAVWAALGLAGIGLLLQLDWLRYPIGIAGILYLLWLSYDSWREANRRLASIASPDHHSEATALRSGVLLSLSNPQNIAYWASLGSAMGAVGISNPQVAHYFIFFCGFMVSSLIWSFLCAALVARVFRQAGERWARLTYRLCALAFLTLALSSAKNLAFARSDVPSKVTLPAGIR